MEWDDFQSEHHHGSGWRVEDPVEIWRKGGTGEKGRREESQGAEGEKRQGEKM